MSRSLGYIAGLRQTGFRVSFRFGCPSDFSCEHLDRILVDYFQVPRAWLSDDSAAETSRDVSRSVHHVAICGLALYQVLGSAAKFPIFEPGRLLKLEGIPDQLDRWSAEAVLPFVDDIVGEVAPQLLQAAFSLVLQLSEMPLDPDAVQQIYEQIDANVIRRITEMPGGKSTFCSCRAAFDADIPFRHLGGGVVQFGWGQRATLAHRSVSLRDSAIGAKLCQDKFTCASLLSRLGLPSPAHGLAVTAEQAVKAAEFFGWPLVVKPVDGERGEGVTTDVIDLNGLKDAFEKARQRSKSRAVLIERQVPGICYRVLVVGGQVIYVQKRLPQSVRGDGSHPVAELVDTANTTQLKLPPWQRGKLIPRDDLATECLTKAGLDWRSVPSPGELVKLRPIESTEWGGVDEDATASMHPENARISLEAAKMLGLYVAGIDIITQDISRPWYDTGAVISEVNFAPAVTLRAAGWLRASTDNLAGHGRFPVWVVLGTGDLLAEARRLTSGWRAKGVRGYITSSTVTETVDGIGVVFAREGLFKRCLAIMMKSDAEGLVIVIDTEEFLETGLPVDRINRICISEATSEQQSFGQETSLPRAELLGLCRQYLVTSNVDQE